MSSCLKYTLFLICLSYLLVCALLLFTRGFLLTRNVIDIKATCFVMKDGCDTTSSPISDRIVQFNVINTLDSRQICSGNKKTKAVIILIDALRFDFFEYTLNISQYLPYKNKFTILTDAKITKRSRLYKFIAHPPTTTLQRIHGLTTGSLPTFVDIGSNFASTEIKEDNIIDQLIAQGRKLVFMGDDTWTMVFPNRFHRYYPFPSFNVWDLDTVDNGVKKHLVPEMKRNDWDVIIAHFLGVDHCGHRFGPRHPEMERKLSEMDDMLWGVLNSMDNSTVLFVFGDHGMTESGDHGGDSPNEVTTPLFVYSENEEIMSQFLEEEEVSQIDLVPTLSNIMGTPIPYSNLGRTFVHPPFQKRSLYNKCSLLGLWSNVNQATKYIDEYKSRGCRFPDNKLNQLRQIYDQLKRKFYSHDMFTAETFSKEAREYLISVREMCQSIWIQFDTFSMSRGLVLMFLLLALVFIVLEGFPKYLFNEILDKNFLIIVFSGFVLSFLSSYILYFLNFVSDFELNLYFITCCTSICILSYFIVINSYVVAEYWFRRIKNAEVLSIFSIFIALLSVLGQFSNSYIVEESSIISFLLCSVIWTSIMEVKPDPSSRKIGNFSKQDVTFKNLILSLRGKLILFVIMLNFLLRFSFFYWQCREEQASTCIVYKDIPKTIESLISLVSFSIFIYLVRVYLRNLGNLCGFSTTMFVIRYCPSICVVCFGFYWILGSVPSEIQPKLFVPNQRYFFSFLVFVITLLSLLVLYISPLCVYLVKDKDRNLIGKPIHSIFKQLKLIMGQKMEDSKEKCPLVYGLATAYSATFINVAVFLSLLMAILIGASRAFVIIISMVSMVFISSLLAVLKLHKNVSLFTVSWFCVLSWGLSSVFFFYGTGHQTTFLNIQWESASLFGDITSTFLPGVLVIMNTFSSQILHAILLPIVFITPFTLAFFFPSLARVSNDVKSGELVIYTKDDLRRYELFSLTVRYILFIGFRVLATMFSACIHSRHLMVWKIFAPKLIFEGFAFIVTLPCCVLGYLYVERISYKIKSLLNNFEPSLAKD